MQYRRATLYVRESVKPRWSMAESLVTFQTSQGVSLRGTVQKLARNHVVFETYTPEPVLRMSEVLSGFTLFARERLVYSGKGLVANLVQTGPCTVCEAHLEDAWVDETLRTVATGPADAAASFNQFLREWGSSYRVLPEFKAVIADIHSFLMDLRNWLDQVELSIRSSPRNDRQAMEQQWMEALSLATTAAIGDLFDKFESIAQRVEPELVPVHTAFSRRQLHPLILAAPFVYRTTQKPLGYAGDYEMVNMMMRNPYEGASLFAKAFNVCALSRPPIVAHRNRLRVLADRLRRESFRNLQRSEPVRVLNVGCGPAQEIQIFLREEACSDRVEFTLVDFNAETLDHVSRALAECKQRYRRSTVVQVVRRSVQAILRQAGKPDQGPAGRPVDFVYCAGLFDYLPDPVCRSLMAYFYGLVAPGGLVLVTNVDGHRSRKEMEYFLDWHLLYRDTKRVLALVPPQIPAENVSVEREQSGINLFLEIRKPA